MRKTSKIATGINLLSLEALNWAICYSFSSSYWVSKCRFSVPAAAHCLQSHPSTASTFCLSRWVLDTLSVTAMSYLWCLMSPFQVPSTLKCSLISLLFFPQGLAQLLGLKGWKGPGYLPANVAGPKSEQSCVPTGVLLLCNHMHKITVAWNFIIGYRECVFWKELCSCRLLLQCRKSQTLDSKFSFCLKIIELKWNSPA